MAPDAAISVEVVYAGERVQDVIALTVPAGTCVREAIALSGLRERHPAMDPAKVGIFGRVVTPDTQLRDGDRVELYRPLLADPKHARRRRAALAR